MPEENETLGERIKRLCLEANMTLSNLSYDTRIPFATLRNWAEDKTEPSKYTYWPQMATALGVRVEYLMLGTGPRKEGKKR